MNSDAPSAAPHDAANCRICAAADHAGFVARIDLDLWAAELQANA